MYLVRITQYCSTCLLVKDLMEVEVSKWKLSNVHRIATAQKQHILKGEASPASHESEDELHWELTPKGTPSKVNTVLCVGRNIT